MKIRYVNEYDDINGFWGVSVSIWFQGCEWRCKNCFNKETWIIDDNTIKDETLESIKNKVLKSIDNYFFKSLSILGGDPLAKFNRDNCFLLVESIKKEKPNIKIALWTGYKWEDVKDLSVIKLIDIIVDGKFEEENKNNCQSRFKGSSNQRVIDVQESLKQNKVILSKYN